LRKSEFFSDSATQMEDRKIGKGYSLPRCTNFPGTVQSNWKKGILLFSFVNSINVVLSDSGLSCLNIGGLSKHRVLKKVLLLDWYFAWNYLKCELG